MNATDCPTATPNRSSADSSDGEKHCVFRSGESWYSVPAVSVREIAISPDLVRVPNCHGTLVGVCHLRSQFIPVVSLDALLGNRSSESARSHNKLMVIQSNQLWALPISEAAALESLDTLIAPEARWDEAIGSPVMGTAMFGEKIVHVLDPNRVFRIAQKTLEQSWNNASEGLLSRNKQGSQR